MADVRKSILENVVTTLKTITTANGYHTNIGTVTRKMSNWTKLRPEDYPAAIPFWNIADYDTQGVTNSYNIVVMTLTVRGSYRDTLDNILDNVEYYIDDIEKAMCVDGTRGGYADYTIPAQIKPFFAEPYTIFEFDYSFTVMYDTVYGTP